MLNLITDAWIPVVDRSGARRVIASWQMADADLMAPDWPRPDLNTGCIELLIGLVRLADPPAHSEDWADRQAPDPERLRARLAPFAPAFALTGDGPRFLQELGGLTGEVLAPDALFIDSGGEGGALTVKAGRYGPLDPALAAMALYVAQTQAPSGGRGNLTSLRGGGPMTVLVEPDGPGGLWPLVWANVPDGRPAVPGDLPWMRPTIPSDKGAIRTVQDGHPAEVFFGMPRRYWLVEDGGRIAGVIQRPSGTRYHLWRHPLTAYYRQKSADEPLPVRPHAGYFGYRHWRGIAISDAGEGRERPATVAAWQGRSKRAARIHVAGWAMSNMKALDYVQARAPLVDLSEAAAIRLRGMIDAAEAASVALRGALAPVLAEGEARETAREAFYVRTQPAFDAALAGFSETEPDAAARRWLAAMRPAALAIFEDAALPGLADRPQKDRDAIVQAHGFLRAALHGQGKTGGKIMGHLGLAPPAPKAKGARG